MPKRAINSTIKDCATNRNGEQQEQERVLLNLFFYELNG
jgi:hypothetical protein